MIIDCMMNIPLLFWASEVTGDKKYYDIGYNHALTSAKYIVRDDFSTFHTFNFNAETGEVIGGKTSQGYSDESCWSRGQAWGIYGFALAYYYTKDSQFLHLAKAMADYFICHLSVGDLPCWDFDAKNFSFAPWDSSAAAICASGCIEISSLCENERDKEKFKGYSERLMQALDKWCVTDLSPNAEPLLFHGSVGKVFDKGSEKKISVPSIQQGLAYGDYFYMETLLRNTGNGFRIW